MFDVYLLSNIKLLSKVKIFLVISNLILIIAVATLYYLYFSEQKVVTAHSLGKASDIVYVNSDSLLESYEYFKNLKTQTEEKRSKLDEELSAKGRSLENKIRSYQEKGGTMTMEQRQQTEESLMQEQQSFLEYKEKLTSELLDEEQKLNKELYDKIAEYLKEYNKEHGHKFILGYTKGGGVLFANDSLDITKSVLEGLNREYKKSSK